MSSPAGYVLASRPARNIHRVTIAALACAVTLVGVLLVHPQSLVHFVYFFFLWNAYVLCLHREDTENFAFAFLVNSAFIAVFVLVQSNVYPDSYGTTSPESFAWTDDSYFFALTADELPPDLFLRENWYLYTHQFTSLIRTLLPLPIEHPLDVLFFQSGTAALLATFSRRLVLQLSVDRKLADTVYVFTLICPFLMMNGGVILIRDTLSAALFVYALTCINSKRMVLAGLVTALQFSLRPGTALILLPAYAIIYWRELYSFAKRFPLTLSMIAAGFVAVAVQVAPAALDYLMAYGLSNVSLLGREVFEDLSLDPSLNGWFLAIQEFPFPIRIVLNAAYIFLYPFLSLRLVLADSSFDLRNVTMSLVVPIYAFWLNAWFFAGALTGTRVIDRQRVIVVAVAAILVLLGIYSLQTRHKVIIYPLYYIVVAIGFRSAPPLARRIGYVGSGGLLLIQLAAAFR